MLIKCSDCGKMVSDKAERCPECGRPMANNLQVKAHKVFVWLMMISIFTGLIGFGAFASKKIGLTNIGFIVGLSSVSLFVVCLILSCIFTTKSEINNNPSKMIRDLQEYEYENRSDQK